MYLPISNSKPAQSVALLVPAYTPSSYLFKGDGDGGSPGGLGQYSSIIGIVTAIVGNVLIALALNVQRYAHIRLHRERKYARERAKQALRNAKNGSARRGYGALDGPDNRSNDGAHEAREGADEADPLTQSFRSDGSRWSENSDDDDDEMPKAPSTYLKSPYWWLGQILITVGECGNFLAYGFAPASIVSPLGVVALISNCVIAPILFKEHFRKRDFWGVVVAVAGAVTVVLSADTQETKLDPHAVWEHITSTGFEIYMGVTCGLIILLMWLSPKYGNRTILVDLGLVGLFGGYTALSTKGISSMLSSTFLKAFTTPVTYVLIFILLGTAIMQVRYVNKALQRFDSTQVIPIQFVVFTLCVIIGSAVLYRDFERTTADRAVKFIGGCFLTFFGVFLITSGRPPSEGDDEETLSDDEGVEETLRLAEQDPNAPQSPTRTRYRDNEENSRRSSKVSFMDAINKPLAVLAETGVPTPRSQLGATSRTSFFSASDAIESAPLLRPSSRDSPAPMHPGISHAISSESAVTLSSVTPVYSEPATNPGTPSQEPPALVIPDDNNVTPRQSSSRPRSSQRFSSHLFSPSPFDSTVRGLVPSTLLKDSPRPSSRRRLSRPSLRSSLYVPQDELEEDEEAGIMSAIERSRTYEESPVEGPKKKGFRIRAKSLTNTVNDLFGVNRKRSKQTDGSEEEEGGRSNQANHSTETL
ncbi:hypothetical protein N0V93_005651 [Gnomoniopsis smithogilvyi]|uniref:Uncharacterized protein n=1 Tax=Gnomoniopsis smithogilvyi TaxID=1191159 RepID=A0A9W9CY80_9PEZI|nr:hypothetical protein N0V93_005651 [Gnomoniopsis smithogilvyi]